MHAQLGINCGFATNRFPEPEVWTQIVGQQLGLRVCQFVMDLLPPWLPDEVIVPALEQIKVYCAEYGVQVETTFTSAFTRVNHLMHPDPGVRQTWQQWFRRWLEMSVELGARGAGSHFGILSVRDLQDERRHEERVVEALERWCRLAEYGAELGLEYLMFEPMSIPREMAHTIEATRRLLNRFPPELPIPMRLCLDVDHGDLESDDSRDTDPYAWLAEFGTVAPCVHIKQSLRDKGGHWPFTPEYNEQGRVNPPEVLAALERSGAEEVTLLFEISHRERFPTEYRVVEDLRASVEYWRQYVAD